MVAIKLEMKEEVIQLAIKTLSIMTKNPTLIIITMIIPQIKEIMIPVRNIIQTYIIRLVVGKDGIMDTRCLKLK